MEDLICYLFGLVPGIQITARNTLNVFSAEELDVALFNQINSSDLGFLPYLIPVECKNWSSPVTTSEVAYFGTRLQNKACEVGILVAANGITGDPGALQAAHSQILLAQSRGQRIIVITRREIQQLVSTNDLVDLIKWKLTNLVASGTSLIER